MPVEHLAVERLNFAMYRRLCVEAHIPGTSLMIENPLLPTQIPTMPYFGLKEYRIVGGSKDSIMFPRVGITPTKEETIYFWGDGAGKILGSKYGGPWIISLTQSGVPLWEKQCDALPGYPCGSSINEDGLMAIGLLDGDLTPQIRQMYFQLRSPQSSIVKFEFSSSSPFQIGNASTSQVLSTSSGLFAVGGEPAIGRASALVELKNGNASEVWRLTANVLPADVPKNATVINVNIKSIQNSSNAIYLLIDLEYYDQDTGLSPCIALVFALSKNDYLPQWVKSLSVPGRLCIPCAFVVTQAQDTYVLCDVLDRNGRRPLFSRIFKIDKTGYEVANGWPQDITLPGIFRGTSISINQFELYIAGIIEEKSKEIPLVASFRQDGSPGSVWSNSLRQGNENWKKICISAIDGYFFLGGYHVEKVTNDTSVNYIHKIIIAKYDRYGTLA